MKTKPARNLKSEIRSALRRVWLYSELRKRAVDRSRVARGVYQCEKCKKFIGPKEYDVDHVIKATPDGGIETPEHWGIFIKRLLYCGDEGVITLCKPCHQIKTNEERRESKKVSKKTKSKKAASVKRLRVSRNKRIHRP